MGSVSPGDTCPSAALVYGICDPHLLYNEEEITTAIGQQGILFHSPKEMHRDIFTSELCTAFRIPAGFALFVNKCQFVIL